MKKSRRLISLVFLAFGLFLAGCSNDDETSSSADDVVELTLWHMEEPPNRVEGFKEVIEKFNEQQEGINVTPQVQSWDDAYSQFPAAIQAGNGPDLLFTLPDYTTIIQDLGVVQPVDDIVNELDEQYGFIDTALNPYQYDDQTWAVPIFGMVQALWYRKDIFE